MNLMLQRHRQLAAAVAASGAAGSANTGLALVIEGLALSVGQRAKLNTNTPRAIIDSTYPKTRANFDGVFSATGASGDQFASDAAVDDSMVASTPGSGDRATLNHTSSAGNLIRYNAPRINPANGWVFDRGNGHRGDLDPACAVWKSDTDWVAAAAPGMLSKVGTETAATWSLVTGLSNYAAFNAGYHTLETAAGAETMSSSHGYAHDFWGSATEFYLSGGNLGGGNASGVPNAVWVYDDDDAAGHKLSVHWDDASAAICGFHISKDVKPLAYDRVNDKLYSAFMTGSSAGVGMCEITNWKTAPARGTKLNATNFSAAMANFTTGVIVADPDGGGKRMFFSLQSLSHASAEWYAIRDIEGAATAEVGTFAGDPAALFSGSIGAATAWGFDLFPDDDNQRVLVTDQWTGEVLAIDISDMTSGAPAFSAVTAGATGDAVSTTQQVRAAAVLDPNGVAAPATGRYIMQCQSGGGVFVYREA